MDKLRSGILRMQKNLEYIDKIFNKHLENDQILAQNNP